MEGNTVAVTVKLTVVLMAAMTESWTAGIEALMMVAH
jgi:hypothetical protein